MHLPASPISFDRNAIDCPCLPLRLVSARDRAAHALNALYEADCVVHTAGEPEIFLTPSASDKGQKIARCPTCRVAVWSNYPQAGHAVRFVRVGTMDNPDLCPPDIHIFTSSKQPWVTLAPNAKAVPKFYDFDTVWPVESRERLRAMRAKAKQS
jgi:hypothetical protein